jgi:hypothetical protein
LQDDKININMDASDLSGGPILDGVQKGTTTFTLVDPAVVVDPSVNIKNRFEELDVESNKIRDIDEFLAKPMPVASGVFDTTQSDGTLLYSGDLYTLFDAQTIWKNKVQGFLNVRGTVKLRLVVNATPFQAGLLRMSVFPCENLLSFEAKSHMFNRETISQVRGVYLNIENDAAEFQQPYVSPTTYIERDQVVGGNFPSWGKVYLHVFQMLRTGGASPTTCNWTLWMSVEDVQLSGQVQPQAKGNNTDKETNSGRGPIATIMSSGKQLASSLGAIPMLRAIAEPTAWALSAAEAAANALGWSKPTYNDGPTPMAMGSTFYNVNTDGNDQCAPLSLRSDNKVTIIDDFTTEGNDEMSFNFIKKRWAYERNFSWSSSVPATTLLAVINVGPADQKKSYVHASTAVKTSPPCAIFSEFFKSYRGSFDYNFKFVKTGYHTGTLAICWLPGLNPVTPLTYNDSAFTYREIFSIQSGSDVCLNFPYMIPQSFINCDRSIGQICIFVVNPLVAPETCSSNIDIFVEVRGGDDLQYAIAQGFGAVPVVPQSKGPAFGDETLDMGPRTVIPFGNNGMVLCCESYYNPYKVIDLLKSFASVGYSIDSEVSSDDEVLFVGDGIWLFVPSGTPFDLTNKFIEGNPIGLVCDSLANLQPQAIDNTGSGLVECKTMGASTHNLTTNYAELSVGEMIMSFRDLLKADYNIIKGSAALNSPFNMGTHKFYAATLTPPSTKTIGPLKGDPVSFVASWFIFHRGAMRYRYHAVNDALADDIGSMRSMLLTSTDVACDQLGNFPGTVSWTNCILGLGGTSTYTYRMFQLPGLNGTLPVQAPFYANYKYCINRYSVAANDGNQSFTNNISLGIHTTNTGNLNLARSIGDDFQFSYFTGIPLYASPSVF